MAKCDMNAISLSVQFNRLCLMSRISFSAKSVLTVSSAPCHAWRCSDICSIWTRSLVLIYFFSFSEIHLGKWEHGNYTWRRPKATASKPSKGGGFGMVQSALKRCKKSIQVWIDPPAVIKPNLSYTPISHSLKTTSSRSGSIPWIYCTDK